MALGFFSKQQIQQNSQVHVTLGETTQGCRECGLDRQCKNPRLKYSGKGKKGILIISSKPSEQEDRQGKLFLNSKEIEILSEHGIDVEEDCWLIRAVSCAPPCNNDGKQRPPEKKEINHCSAIVQATIKLLEPKHIWIFGADGISSFFGSFLKKPNYELLRGTCIPDVIVGAYVSSFIGFENLWAKEKDTLLRAVMNRDLANAVQNLNKKPFQIVDHSSKVKILLKHEHIIEFLDNVINSEPENLYHDFETSGLKPYAKGHKIATIAINTDLDPDYSYSFPFMYRDFFNDSQRNEIRKRLVKILGNRKIKKHAHNYKYEDTWSRVILGVDTMNWHWDGMFAAHVLDNRSSWTGLKFQTYINFGIRPYDDSISKYLKSEQEGGNTFNRIDEAPLQELLQYGGFDVHYGRMLHKVQKAEFNRRNPELMIGFNILMTSAKEMSYIQHQGICIDEDYFLDAEDEMEDKVKTLKERLLNGKEAQKFFDVCKRKLTLTSNKDLGVLFYEVLGNKAIYTDGTEVNYSTDKIALEKMSDPFVVDLLEMKKLEKAKGTYLAQFKRESLQGVIHPFFDLHIPVSMRSSSSMPNFQNIPTRDAMIKGLIRGGVIPMLGSLFGEHDYKGIEVATSAMYHKDPNMIKYITDPSTDMHRDTACDIWMLNPKEVSKEIRFFAKNCWVFAQFYGDWFGSCGPNLWSNVWQADLKTVSGKSIREHMQSKGITELGRITKQGPTPGSFLEHLAHVEDIFWNQRFQVYGQWKKDIVKFYEKHGYIDSKHGFRYSGIMGKNDATNYPIQGSAFHFLLWTVRNVARIARKEKWRSAIIAQIHDCIVDNTFPDELNHIIETINYIGTVKIREAFDWICVPLEIEHEFAALNQPWSKKRGVVNKMKCTCGIEWLFENKKDGVLLNYECPVCSKIYPMEK